MNEWYTETSKYKTHLSNFLVYKTLPQALPHPDFTGADTKALRTAKSIQVLKQQDTGPEFRAFFLGKTDGYPYFVI